jgi:excisionase family DNA binding protein
MATADTVSADRHSRPVLQRRRQPPRRKQDADKHAAPQEELPQLPLLMRVEDVMHELSISRRTVYQLLQDGHLHLVRVGLRNTRVRAEEVLALAGASSKPLRVATLRNQKNADQAAGEAAPE